MKKIIYLLAIATLMFASCSVNDPIYDTPHPDKGKITLTADWSGLGIGVVKPSGYDISVGGYGCTLSGDCNTLNNLFAPGTYTGLAWNTADKITVSGSTATVAVAGGYVDAQPGWLFTACDNNVVVEKGKHHQYTATMQQQVRQLTIDLTVTEGDPARISSVTGTLNGVAGAWNFDTDTAVGDAVSVVSSFTRATDKITASMRLLGIVPSATQMLTLVVTFSDNSTQTIEKDLSSLLTGFNTNQHLPIGITAGVQTQTEVEVGFTCTINDWQVTINRPGTAN